MSEWKEVWHPLKHRECMPPNATGALICGVEVKVVDVFDWGFYCMYSTGVKIPTPFHLAQYYTTGQKRRRVVCGCKGGVFYLPSIEGGYYEPHPCDKCKGTGKIWEYSE